jgi:CRISPR-associated endonuclease/helicase Cas3
MAATGLANCVSFTLQLSDEEELSRELIYLKARRDPGSRADSRDMLLSDHLEAAGREAEQIARKLALPEPVVSKLVTAAQGHDLGKARRIWQEYAGNPGPTRPKAKSSRYLSGRTLGGYRHELGSVVDLGPSAEPLVRHLVATHHGHGRPVFPEHAMDREHPGESREQCALQLRQFSALQREYGWWGLAYLEALLKSADARASS